MAEFQKIRVMISSQCKTKISYQEIDTELSNIRKELKNIIEQETLFGKKLFDVWISEDPPAPDLADNSWEVCLKEVKKSHILIVLYTGAAGWAKGSAEIGICHAELDAAISMSPGKVRFIKLPETTPLDESERERNKRFADYISKLNPFWREAQTGEQIIELTKEALREAVAKLVIWGVREARKGKFHLGAALDWSRLDFEDRRDRMVDTLRKGLIEHEGTKEHKNDIFLNIYNKSVLALCHAIPASMTVPSAREMVGQPFLHDHKFDAKLKASIGPVHFIACSRSITEAQAMKQLGFPDATIVSPPFGVYVADDIQKIQLIFIANCRDETTTLHGVQRVFEWLDQTGEDKLLVERASARRRIITAIAKEVQR